MATLGEKIKALRKEKNLHKQSWQVRNLQKVCLVKLKMEKLHLP